MRVYQYMLVSRVLIDWTCMVGIQNSMQRRHHIQRNTTGTSDVPLNASTVLRFAQYLLLAFFVCMYMKCVQMSMCVCIQ